MRPTIALCCIAKNEEKNIERLTKSIEGCFDNIYLTDTGSTDNTVEVAKKLGWNVNHFEWVQDFGKARNFAFSHAKEDYVMWLDLDDVLTNKENFILWRNTAMEFADYWIATYDYAHDEKGNPVVSFARERVVKNRKIDRWNYFLHEGMPIIQGESAQYSTTWKVSHQRTAEDLTKDKGRNLSVFKKHMDSGVKLNSRMQFYYGKELFENNMPAEAIPYLLESGSAKDTEMHDRVLSIQYAAFSCMAAAAMLNPQHPSTKEKIEKYYVDGIKIASQGLLLDSHRAEFWTTMGDCHVKINKIKEAIPFYIAAMSCNSSSMPGQAFAQALFSFADASTKYPRNQLIRCYFNIGMVDKAVDMAIETQKLCPNPETETLLAEAEKIKNITVAATTSSKPCEDVVFTCPPVGMYEWDEEIYKTKGMGGSETACIETAKWIKKLTGRNVIVFNNRQNSITAESGVEYRPSAQVNDYMAKHKPKVHIAWRHNLRCTDAKTYLWCHDLYTQGVESVNNFDKHICLSGFHKDYVMAMQGVPEDKILISRNGVVPERFIEKVSKDPLKLVYPSSPDRGLDKLIVMLDEVRKTHDISLHVFYGFENLYKSGPQMSALADKIKGMISERPWIKFHGLTEQSALTKHLMSAALWVHPANFIESFCITAIEMLCAGVYPITRTLGALKNTLGEAKEKGMAHLFEENCVTPEEIQKWANKVRWALDERAWERVQVDVSKYSWESVTKSWIEEMGL